MVIGPIIITGSTRRGVRLYTNFEHRVGSDLAEAARDAGMLEGASARRWRGHGRQGTGRDIK